MHCVVLSWVMPRRVVDLLVGGGYLVALVQLWTMVPSCFYGVFGERNYRSFEDSGGA
jgi:uncharacterized membrane protein